MPISSFAIVSIIACELNSAKPATVLDLGCGSGFYGSVVRTFVDMGWSRKTRIEGVEIFRDYKGPNWDNYSMVYVRSIPDFMAYMQGAQYDCILFLDVIEHMEQTEGLRVLEQLKRHLTPGGLLLVSTPGEFTPQGAEYGNEYEKHISFFSPDEFAERGFIILKDGRVKDQFNQFMTVAKFVNNGVHIQP